MHFRYPFDPVSLVRANIRAATASMDPYYGDFSGLPRYNPGMENHNVAPAYYGGVYDPAAAPMRAFDPIVPHGNDVS